MKIVHLLDKSQYVLSEEQAEALIQVLQKGTKWLQINQDLIASHQVSKITDIEKKPYFMGSPMTNDLRFVLKGGERVPFMLEHKDRIEWKEESPEQEIKQLN